MNQRQEKLNSLYETMSEKYRAWADVYRPEAGKMGPMSLMAHEEYLEKLGNFRAKQWGEYVKARDDYEKFRDSNG